MTLYGHWNLSQLEELHVAHLVNHATRLFAEDHCALLQVVTNTLCACSNFKLLHLLMDFFHLFFPVLDRISGFSTGTSVSRTCFQVLDEHCVSAILLKGDSHLFPETGWGTLRVLPLRLLRRLQLRLATTLKCYPWRRPRCWESFE